MSFRYNLTWERGGARCNAELRENRTPLEEVETVIPPGKGWRWLSIEVAADDEAEAFLEALDEACGIPKPRPISVARRKVA